MDGPRDDVTRLLAQVSAGQQGAAESLFPLIYDELHALAQRHMHGERHDHTLQATALVHEAFIRLGGGKDVDWESRAQFFQFAARAMRSILIDHARRRAADRKGGGWERTPLEEDVACVGESSVDLLALNDSLERLAKVDEQTARIVELRFFGGLTVEEAARVVGVCERTIKNDWRVAKAWLKQDIAGPADD